MKFVNGFVPGSQTLYGKRLYIKSLSALGRMLPSQTTKRIGQGNAIRPIFFRIRRAIRAAAGSASIKNGIGQVFLSVMRERTKPGQIVLT